MGVDHLRNIMPDVIQMVSRTDIPPNVRDGYIMLFIYLPVVFEEEFLHYVGPIIPLILQVNCCVMYVSI